ncbi:MAG: hypothetical protein J6K52_00005, partial [Clostridia bacterium]|nr:hypothetical protein [Clostridia bacterium]
SPFFLVLFFLLFDVNFGHSFPLPFGCSTIINTRFFEKVGFFTKFFKIFLFFYQNRCCFEHYMLKLRKNERLFG